MAKPVMLSKTIKSFIQLCQAYTNREIDMKKVDLVEEEVLSKLKETETQVHKALCDDFNTCIALENLGNLINYINKLFQASFKKPTISTSSDSNLNRNYACIMSVCNYLESMLEIFGLSYGRNETATVTSSSTSSLNVNKIVEASLSFRRDMRNLAIDNNQVAAEIKSKIFASCDKFREDLGKANIEFKVTFKTFLFRLNFY